MLIMKANFISLLLLLLSIAAICGFSELPRVLLIFIDGPNG